MVGDIKSGESEGGLGRVFSEPERVFWGLMMLGSRVCDGGDWW